MGINGYNDPSILTRQINPPIINPAQQQGQSAGAISASPMSLNGTILTPENISLAEQNTPIVNVETFEVEMEDFLAEMNLAGLDVDNIASADTNSMPNDVIKLLDNKIISTVDITYTPAEDGSVVTEHYSQDNPPKLLAKTTQFGDSTVSVAYNQDGIATKTSTIENGVTTMQTFDSAGQRVIEETVVGNGTSTTTKFDEQGNSLGSIQVKGAVTSEYSSDGTLTKKSIDKGNGLVYESTYSQNENGQTVETTKNPIGDVAVTTKNAEGKSLEQTVTTQSGQTHSVKYDGNGNTKITVQNGETMAQIAQKFDCSVEDLKSMNKTYGSGNQTYFQAGQEIVVPGEVAADDARLTSRDSKEVAQAKFTATQNEIEAKNRQIEQGNQPIEDSVIDDSEKTANRKAKLREGGAIALKLYSDMNGIGTSPEIAEHLDMINSENVVETLNTYKAKSRGEGLLTAITGEVFAMDLANKDPLNAISSALTERAENSGVAQTAIQKFKSEFENAKTGMLDRQKLQNAVDVLAGEISSKEINATEVNTEEAIQRVANSWEVNVETATENFNAARELDSNIGVATDAVLGFFGCTTIDDMAEKLDLDAATAKKLTNASQTGDVEAFKSVYKEIFHRDFDPQLVASYDQTTLQYLEAKEYAELGNTMSYMLTNYNNALIQEHPDYKDPMQGLFGPPPTSKEVASQIQARLQSQLNITAEQYNQLLESNGGDVKTLLTNLKGGFDAMRDEITGGKTFKQMEQDIANMELAIFGGNSAIADVAKFNKNQMITDIAGNIITDVAVGTALSLIPGGVAVAGPKMAASAAKFTNLATKAPKTVKLYNNISKAYNSSKTMKNLGKASRTFAESVTKDIRREEVLGFIHNEEKDSVELFENTVTNTSIKMGVNFLAKSMGVNSKLLESAVSSALQVGVGTASPEMAFFKTVLGSTKLSADQQKILAKHLNINYERFVENA